MPGGADFELVRIDGDHWLVRDRRHPSSDARHVLACLTESDEGLDVVWLDPAVPLPIRYRVREDVLDDLARWTAPRVASTRPVAIPSHPPLFARVRRAG